MVDSKKIGIAGAAVVLVTLVTIFGTSYMADFENNPRNVSQNNSQENELKAIELKHAPVLGSDTATVTIVEVGDYQCHMCKKWFEETRPLIIENYIETGKANLVFIDMPFLGYDSTPASEASYCADDQEKYWQFHDELYKNWGGERTGWITRDALTEFAKEVKLDINEFNQCLDDQKYEDKVTKLYDFGKNIGIDATPSFLVFNNENIIKIRGNQPLEVFLKTFDELR